MQQRGQHLAALGGIECHLAAAQAGGPEREREVAAAGACALRLDGLKQRPDGPPPHGLVAVEMIGAVGPQADEGGEETRGGAGVADVDPRLAHGDLAAATGDGDGQGVLIRHDDEAQRAQRRDHDLRVPAEEGAVQRGCAPGQRGEDERAVGDALGAGQGDTAAHRFGERLDRERGRIGEHQ
jgi:hypothetical protein